MKITLGCIADDLTGATDLAMILVREGMKTVQIVGVPKPDTPVPDADAVVIALKSRTIPTDDAIKMSVASCDWLKKAGAQQIFFKYCSTFDSTADGNIGPVTDALMENLDTEQTIACPSFPENGRTVYRGYLFVNDGLLSESSLRNHPLTPMRDPNLKRVLSKQSKSTISNIYYETIEKGHGATHKAMQDNKQNRTIYIMDAISDDHLRTIGQACDDMALITGGSAVAQGLPDNYRKAGLLPQNTGDVPFDAPDGPSIILSGSCSEATRAQVDYAQDHMPSFRLDALNILDNKPVADEAVAWAEAHIQSGTPVLFYSSADPDVVSEIQQKRGRVEVGSKVEKVISEIARRLKDIGVRRFVVAGGETSGAVINALNVRQMEIGPQIDPGVPWTKSIGDQPLALALKSGNFGGEDFFLKALNQLDGGA
ncbi:3-oxo-tetronate kinase [Terasakiella sp. A23]|uniref:3-oxo-tetronate kinase n=1 Tax=Terasakiella sp. FCG-A23 TaxID=3080561 RepID=UPI002953E734|nr:3-oxo-tetronate kinase [Terasakiella sp. A23]MDV7340582.1 3-oxo-tetronate kinase [Terasakiella sp. A23]